MARSSSSFSAYFGRSRSALKQLLFGLTTFGAGAVVAQSFEFQEKPQAQATPTHKWNANWDGREPKDLKDRERAKGSRHLILIRHGQYNLSGATDAERTLTVLGREQARITGQRLTALNLPLTSMVNSTMSRAVETADIIADCLKKTEINENNNEVIIEGVPRLKPDDLLREGHPIAPEPMLSSMKSIKNYGADGERIDSAFRKYFYRPDPSQKKDTYEVIVCHANVIRYFFCKALQLPPEAWLRLSLKHASLTFITIRPDGRVNSRGLGDAGHFSVDKITLT